MGIFAMNIGYARVSTLDQNLNLQIGFAFTTPNNRFFKTVITK